MPDSQPRPSLLARLVELFWRELAKFGLIGAISFVIDVGGFNLLLHTVLPGKVTTAKIISGTVATLFAYAGNRYWTFRNRRSRPVHHEIGLFFLVNGIGLAISTAWLAFTTYALGFSSIAAVNVNNIIGIGLATIFRFWSYKRFVFAGEHLGEPDQLPPGDLPPGDAGNADATSVRPGL